MNKLTKKVLQECIIYPKANPVEIEKEISKIKMLVDKSEKTSISEEKIINNVSKSFDIKQRIKNDKEWIKYID